jgi:plasmid stabilization system protein ParE
VTGYRLAPSVRADLRELFAYVAEQDGVDRALQLHARFLEAFEFLGAALGAGRVHEDLTGPAVLWWTIGNYLVAYDDTRLPIEALHVLDGRRDIRSLFQSRKRAFEADPEGHTYRE